jgi:hypothetical protein
MLEMAKRWWVLHHQARTHQQLWQSNNLMQQGEQQTGIERENNRLMMGAM